MATQKKEVVFDKDGIWAIDDDRPDGKLLLVKENGSAQEEYFEPTHRAACSRHSSVRARKKIPARYAADPGEILVMTPKLSDYRRLYRWTRRSESRSVTPDIKFDLSENFVIDYPRNHVFYHVNEGGFTRLHALDARTYREIKLPAIGPGDHEFILSTTRNGRYAVIGLDTGKSPVVSYVVEWPSGKFTQWQLPSAPEIDTTRFARASLETYPARDGTPIPMLVRRPEACATATDPCPVVISFHGGPEGQSVPGFSTRAQIFVDAGLRATSSPTCAGARATARRGFTPTTVPSRMDVITDIEDASKFVRTAWAKNGKAPKVGISRRQLRWILHAHGHDDVRWSLRRRGVDRRYQQLGHVPPEHRALPARAARQRVRGPEKDRESLVKLSPTTYIDRVKAPILLVQGASDPRVPVGEALQFHDALEAKRIPNRLIIFANEGHGSQRRENQVLQLGHVLQFFDTYLKPRQ